MSEDPCHDKHRDAADFPLIDNSLLHLLASGELDNNGFLHLSTARTRTVIVGVSTI